MPEPHDQEYQEHGDRSQRIEALRNLARQGDIQSAPPPGALSTPPVTPPAPPAPAIPGRRSRKPLLVAAISALVLIAVTGGLIARAIVTSRSATQTSNTPTTHIIPPGDNQFSCPRDAAWSPDGARVALLGYRQACPSAMPDTYQYRSALIMLYDVARDKITTTISPDTIISDALHLGAPAIATPLPFQYPLDTSHQVIDYRTLSWSPDGKQLAASFSVLLATAQPAQHDFVTTSIEGVLLVSPSGTTSRVFSHTLGKSAWHCRAFGAGSFCQQAYVPSLGTFEWYSGLWNLTTGAYVPPASPEPAPSPDTSWYANRALLPPATAYQWGASGRLQPVGRANSANAVSVWQSGIALLVTQHYPDDPNQPPQPLKTPVEVWQSSFAAWSPDGDYLLADSAISGWRIAVPGQTAPDEATLAQVGLANAPVLQPPNAAMTAVLKSYHDVSQTPNGAQAPLFLARSPDGKRLAVEAPPSAMDSFNGIQRSDFAVYIYDCASGKLLGALTPDVVMNGAFSGQAILRWSPDSSHLLLYNPLLSGAQIWGPKELPKAAGG